MKHKALFTQPSGATTQMMETVRNKSKLKLHCFENRAIQTSSVLKGKLQSEADFYSLRLYAGEMKSQQEICFLLLITIEAEQSVPEGP